MSLLFDVIADLHEGITVMPVFAANKAEALKAAHAQDFARTQHPTGRLSAVPAELQT
jgi:hypothetical protein